MDAHIPGRWSINRVTITATAITKQHTIVHGYYKTHIYKQGRCVCMWQSTAARAHIPTGRAAGREKTKVMPANTPATVIINKIGSCTGNMWMESFLSDFLDRFVFLLVCFRVCFSVPPDLRCDTYNLRFTFSLKNTTSYWNMAIGILLWHLKIAQFRHILYTYIEYVCLTKSYFVNR